MPKPIFRPTGGYDHPAVAACKAAFSSRLHMPEASPLFAALGAVCANYFTGNPVWLMLVGSPSTGKTVIVKACSALPNCRIASDSHNASAFLTSSAKRGKGGLLSPSRIEHGGETGGIGDFGIILYPEFSSILDLPPDARAFVTSVHRQIYDGAWSREYGSDGGITLSWSGKAGALGAVTAAIDQHAMSSALGERWLYYRLPDPDHLSQARVATESHSEDPADRNAALSAAVLDIFHVSGIEKGMTPRPLILSERTKMGSIVRSACLLRGSVTRDRFHRDVIALPQTEGSGRIVSALTSIYLALERLGLRNHWCWKIVRHIAADCCPALRLQIVRHCRTLEKCGKPITSAGVHAMLPISQSVITRGLEEIKLLGVLTHDGANEDEPARWRLDQGINKLLQEMEDDL